MDNSDSHVEETQDVEANQYDFNNEELFLESSSQSIDTQEHEEGESEDKCIRPDGSVVTNQYRICNLYPESRRVENLKCNYGDRIILNFGPHNQPEGRNGGLFGRWLGAYCDTFPLGLTYKDWRQIEKHKKDECWNEIQKMFYFDASNEKYKKYVMKHFSQRYKDAKNRLWRRFQGKTLEEAMENMPEKISGFISKEEWQDFVKSRFSEKAKKLREQNIKSRRHYKTPHTLGTKSIARFSKEKLIETGKRPSRGEIFLYTRQKAPFVYVSEEARIISEKLIEKMPQYMGNTSENNTNPSMHDEFYEVCGKERPGRVRCAGLGPISSTFFNNRTASNEEENVEKFLHALVKRVLGKLCEKYP